MIEQQGVDGNFSNTIFFSDEALFPLDGYVNKQNCRIWGPEKPQVAERGHYRDLLLRNLQWNDCHHKFGTFWSYDSQIFFILPDIEEYGDLEKMWFQQDSATCHTTQVNMVLLQEIFIGYVISRHGDINWPPKDHTI